MVHDCPCLVLYWITVVRNLLIINYVYLNMIRMLAPIVLLQYTMTLGSFLLDRCQGKSYMNTLHILHHQNYNCTTWFVVGVASEVLNSVLKEKEIISQSVYAIHEKIHTSSLPVFSGVYVTLSLVLCVCFVGRCLSFCSFSFGHCVVCPSIYGFWFPLWYLKTLLDSVLLRKVWRYQRDNTNL